jgi:hypothetical protein
MQSVRRVPRPGFGRAGGSRRRRSPRCPSRSAACPILSTCASAGAVAGMRCGTQPDARVRKSRVWPRRTIINTPIAALPESFGRLSKLTSLCVRRAPARVGAALARPVLVGVGRAVAGCGAARDRMRACDVLVSAAQVYQEHADRRAARVARQPFRSRHTVRAPGTCARGCGTCASGERWSPRGCGWMRCGTRSDARVSRRGFGRAGRSGTRRSPRCPSRSAAWPSSPICASAGHLARVAAALARPMLVGVHRAAAGCGAARDQMRVF